jgi:hypothetical protein
MISPGAHRILAPHTVYPGAHNQHRPHRALALSPPEPERKARSGGSEIRRRGRLGGLTHEYYRAVA